MLQKIINLLLPNQTQYPYDPLIVFLIILNANDLA